MSESLRSARMVAVAALAVLLFDYPLLALFDVDVRVLGVPLLWAYLFTAWAAVIARRRLGHDGTPVGARRPGSSSSRRWPTSGCCSSSPTYGDRRADRGRSVISNGYVYALSLAVYATSWTFYGSVGRAASTGIGFLPIYLGPTVMAALWWLVLRKIIRISRRQPHHLARGLRVLPLRQEQLPRRARHRHRGGGDRPLHRAAAQGHLDHLRHPARRLRAGDRRPRLRQCPCLQDTALYAALLLAAFTIVFGTRHLDATERHEGMVAAIAFESLVKLVAFLAVGCYVTFVLFDGFGDVFGRAAARADLADLFTQTRRLRVVAVADRAVDARDPPAAPAVAGGGGGERRRAPPQEGDVAVPALPAARSTSSCCRSPSPGCSPSAARSNADAFVLALPLADRQQALALLVFIGGLSAATGMVIVETIALSTMVSNSLVVPLLLRRSDALAGRRDLGGLILGVRRVTIVLVLLLGFVYFRVAGEALALVSIGLISFAAVAQFAPAILGGLFWKGATRRGAIGGARGRASRCGPTRCRCRPWPRPAGCPASFLERRPVRGGHPRALRAVRARRARHGQPLDDVEHAGQRRRSSSGCP